MKRIILLVLIMVEGIIFLFSTPFVLAQEVVLRRVEVDLSSQRLYAFDGQSKVFDFTVSTGKPWWPTPTGTFYPWIKLRFTRMEGGSLTYGTYYNLPKVPYVIYFGNSEVPNWRGFGLHGTYWHNNFGIPMSHGCVNLRTADMEILYNWMELSTPIVIYGQTPGV